MVKHVGFQHASEMVAARQHIPMMRAKAIIAAGARGASAKAKRRNPRLKRVKGQQKKKSKKY